MVIKPLFFGDSHDSHSMFAHQHALEVVPLGTPKQYFKEAIEDSSVASFLEAVHGYFAFRSRARTVSNSAFINARDYALAQAAQPFLGTLGFKIIAIAALFSTASGINATLYGGANVGYMLARD